MQVLTRSDVRDLYSYGTSVSHNWCTTLNGTRVPSRRGVLRIIGTERSLVGSV